MSTIERERVQAPVTTRDVLHRAADLLEEFGWCQSELGSKSKGIFCLVGVTHEAMVDLGVPGAGGEDHIYAATDDYLIPFFGPYPESWNDFSGRTKAEVVAELRRAAEAA